MTRLLSLALGVRWEVPPSIAVGLGALLVLYLVGIGPGRPADPGAEPVGRRRALLFVGGLLTLFVALTGPLDDLADHLLFSAHMVQHLLLMLVVPPLLLSGIPAWLLRPVVHSRPAFGLAHLLTRPPVAFTLFNVTLITWHLPVLYNWALGNGTVHVAMHLCFLAAGVVGWWPVIGSLPELARPSPIGQLCYAGLIGVPMMVVAACVALADGVLYPLYAAAPRLWGLTPLQDQKLGAVIMWIPAQWVFIIPLTIVFYRWVRSEADTRDERL